MMSQSTALYYNLNCESNPMYFTAYKSGTANILTTGYEGIQNNPIQLIAYAPQVFTGQSILKFGRVQFMQGSSGEELISAGDSTLSGSEGASIKISVNTGLCKGQISTISLINTRRILENNDDVKYMLSTNKRFVLDSTQSQSSFLYNDKITILGDDVIIHPFVDSPSQEVTNEYKGLTIIESFKTFLVYKSNADIDSFWVPIAKVEWSWSVEAHRTEDIWSIDQSQINQGVISTEVNYGEMIWTSNIDQYEFTPISML